MIELGTRIRVTTTRYAPSVPRGSEGIVTDNRYARNAVGATVADSTDPSFDWFFSASDFEVIEPEPVPEPRAIQVGDRVRALDNTNNLRRGSIGTVVNLDPVGGAPGMRVRFDYGFRAAWATRFELVVEPEAPAAEETADPTPVDIDTLQVGDIVRLARTGSTGGYGQDQLAGHIGHEFAVTEIVFDRGFGGGGYVHGRATGGHDGGTWAINLDFVRRAGEAAPEAEENNMEHNYTEGQLEIARKAIQAAQDAGYAHTYDDMHEAAGLPSRADMERIDGPKHVNGTVIAQEGYYTQVYLHGNWYRIIDQGAGNTPLIEETVNPAAVERQITRGSYRVVHTPSR